MALLIPCAVSALGQADYDSYTDLAADGWYREYVEYMLEKGCMAGTSDGLFEPNGGVTYEQTVQILYSAAGSPKVTSSATADEEKTPALLWAFLSGLTGDTPDMTPDRLLTREQLACILWRNSGKQIVQTDLLADFSDADEVGEQARMAVNWAVSEGILIGTDTRKLLPQAEVTRVQCAAMLTRWQKAAEAIPVPDTNAVW